MLRCVCVCVCVCVSARVRVWWLHRSRDGVQEEEARGTQGLGKVCEAPVGDS